MHRSTKHPFVLLACAGLALSAPAEPSAARPCADRPVTRRAAQPDPISIVSLDVVALDRAGRIPDDLGPEDFTVTVDGAPRRVLWVRHVSRGPGAETDAALRQESRGGPVVFAAEPARTVLALVDQTTMRRGSEKAVTAAVNAFVDRLGLDDRLAVLRLPLRPDTLIELSTDRPSAREAVRQVTSLAMPSVNTDIDDLFARPQNDPNRTAAVDPDRTGDPDRVVPPEIERQLSTADAAPAASELDPALRGRGLAGLHALLVALRDTPGRKVVALFSAGVHGASQTEARQAAAAAAAARAVVYVFGLEGARGPDGRMPETAPLEELAAATGGRFARLDRRPERTVEAVIPELQACYVLGIEWGMPADDDARPGTAQKPRSLRVSLERKALTPRAAAWVVPTPEPDDLVPAPAPGTRVDPGRSPEAAPAARAGAGAATSRSASDASAREAELRQALARMTAYVESYVREYAALVAEEDYRQNTGSGSFRRSTRLRSDVLLVRPGASAEWMCFRDVFEVDGHPQRDREDRLKRLFLDPSLEAAAQLRAIKEESARYNIGPVIRNLNVPLFPLVILEPDNVPRFRFRIAKKQESGGVERWRIDYDELLRPTIVTSNDDRDVPISGSFLIDPMTGAIIESRLSADTERGRADLAVTYRRDPELGFWVPAEMTEFYRNRSYVTLADGRATYSNFRRFQVKTEQTITVPK